MTPVRTAITVLLLALTTPACGLPGETSAEPSAEKTARFVDEKCADLVVLGLRGSGQSLDLNNGVGQELNRSLRSMVKVMEGDVTVRLQAIDYKAQRSVNYYDGIADGRRKLFNQFTELSKECADTTFAFIGFSQGAQAVHEYAFDMTKKQASRVALVALMADPRRNAKDDIRYWSYADKAAPDSGKLGAGETFNTATRPKVLDLCVAQDEICSWNGGPEDVSDTHKHFYEKPANARTTGKQLATALKRNGIG